MTSRLDPIHPEHPVHTRTDPTLHPADPTLHPADPPDTPRWEDRTDALLGIAALDLDAGGLPLPMLAAFAGPDPVGLATIRPFAPGEATQAVVELLALLLPLGADRVAMSLPGRAWSTRDPIVPVVDDVDLRATVLVLLDADACDGPCRIASAVHPVTAGASWHIDPPLAPEESPQAPLADALRILLDARDELSAPDDGGAALAAQYGRVLLLGHDLVLAPEAALRIGRATAATPDA